MVLDMGYTMTRIHEVWNFENKESGLITEYVNTRLKIKTEASAWPKDCTTVAKKQNYLERFDAKETTIYP